MAHPAVVGAEYCRPGQELHLVYTGRNDKVTDLNRNLLFNVRRPFFSNTITITDPTDRPILRLCRKALSSTWQIFPGPKSSNNPLLFIVKRSSALQLNLSMHVFLGSNADPDRDRPDYKVKRAFGHSTIEMSFREQIVAKVNRKTSSYCCVSEHDITVAPAMDFVFVLSLFLIVNQHDLEAAQGGPTW